VVITAPGDDTTGLDAGAAYLFRTNGELVTTITSPSAIPVSGCGASVSALGHDRVFIGAPFDRGDGDSSGAGWLFSTRGTLIASIPNPAPTAFGRFGLSAAPIGTDQILIGAPGNSAGMVEGAGTAYLFTLPSPVAGGLDLAFAPTVVPGSVRSIAVQPDGKIVVVGPQGIKRLLSNGAVESTATFNPGTGAPWITATAVQADGKIVIAGVFRSVNGQTRNHIARLNSNGTLEGAATFNPGTGVSGQTVDNHAVNSVAVQADGKILLVGQFTRVNGQSRKGIARLLTNGTVESTATFNPGTGVAGADANVYCVVVQTDGKILIGGDFTSVNGQPRKGIARLLANGTLEGTGTFNPGTGVEGIVLSMAVQADEKILIKGLFTAVDAQPRAGLARLLPNGTLESAATFNPGIGSQAFNTPSMAVQADGKILIVGSGSLTLDAGVTRLLADGTVESTLTFNPNFGPDGYLVSVVAVQADGKILIAGQFSSIDGQPRPGLARLDNDPAPQSLTLAEAARVQWLRGGAAPEVEHVTFEASTNSGVQWTPLGPGIRVPGGWELTGLTFPATGSLRARGRTIGGINNGSSGLVEMVATFAELPALTITQTSAEVIVAWPSPSTGFVLQQNSDLNTPNWILPTQTITDNGTWRSITVSPALDSRFYRLFKP